MKSDLVVVPLTLKQANNFVDTYHTHNKKVVGCKFCIGVKVLNTLEAVAIVGRPVARRLDDGLTVEILRLCTKQTGIKNLCSLLYSRSWRLWKLMGGKRIITYTLEEENGASLKASGYKLQEKLNLLKKELDGQQEKEEYGKKFKNKKE